MATSSELVQSVLTALVLAQNTEMDENQMFETGVIDILMQMDGLASDLVEVLE